jgi:CMP-N,N'-diacetyllegionaminic acid synthase
MNTYNHSCSKILTIIPARAGSKRIPGKNSKHLSGIPLIAWSIKSALDSLLEYVVVSTDNQKIADISLKYGAKVPFIRSYEFATDEASVIDVVLEVIELYQQSEQAFDAVLLLQPTSPFRTIETIRSAINQFDGKESIISVSPARSHPYWCKRIENGELFSFNNMQDLSLKRSQDLPNAYELNGSIYLSSIDNIIKNKSFYSDNTRALIISSEEEALDIDTPFDWFIAEAIANNRVKV